MNDNKRTKLWALLLVLGLLFTGNAAWAQTLYVSQWGGAAPQNGAVGQEMPMSLLHNALSMNPDRIIFTANAGTGLGNDLYLESDVAYSGNKGVVFQHSGGNGKLHLNGFSFTIETGATVTLDNVHIYVDGHATSTRYYTISPDTYGWNTNSPVAGELVIQTGATLDISGSDPSVNVDNVVVVTNSYNQWNRTTPYPRTAMPDGGTHGSPHPDDQASYGNPTSTLSSSTLYNELDNDGRIVTGNAPAWVTGQVMTRNAVISSNPDAMITGTGTFGNLVYGAGSTATTVTGASTIKLANGARVQVVSNLTLENNLTLTTVADGAYEVVVSGGTVTAQEGAAVTLAEEGDLTLDGGSVNFAATGASLTVNGDVEIKNAASGWNQGANTATVTGNFTVSAMSGELSANEPNTTRGTLNVGGNFSNTTSANADYKGNLVFTRSATTHEFSSTGDIHGLTVQAGVTDSLNTVVTKSNIAVAAGLTTIKGNAALEIGETFNFTTNSALVVEANGEFVKKGTGNVTATTGTNTNAGTITHNGGGTFALGTITNNGIIENDADGTLTIATLTNNADKTVRNDGAGTLTINALAAGTNDGAIENNGTGSTTVKNTSADIINKGIFFVKAGTLTLEAETLLVNQNTLEHEGGTFLVKGDLKNSKSTTAPTHEGKIISKSITDAVADLESAPTQGQAYAKAFAEQAMLHGIIVTGDFVNESDYTGNVIMDHENYPSKTTAIGSPNYVSGPGFFGHLTIVNDHEVTELASDIEVGHLILYSGEFDLNSYDVNVRGVTVPSSDVNKVIPAAGVYTARNGHWDHGSVIATGGSGKYIAFGQETAALVNGSFESELNTGVQLVSDAWWANATLAAGAVVEAQLNAVCYDLTVSGSTTGDGTVKTCGVFTITSATPSIREQLIDANINPDHVNVSVEIAIPNDATIELTHEPGKGVTIQNTQRNFILKNGSVKLNDADLVLHGGFTYSDVETNGNSKVFSTVSTNFANRGYLVFVNNTVSGVVPQANFRFTRDAVNSTGDFFTIQRVKINRGNGVLAIVDGNESGNASTVVVTERLEVLNGSTVAINDNNIRYIGGNQGNSTPNARRVVLASSNISGTGYFDLGNNHVSDTDLNTIEVNKEADLTATAQSGSWVLNTQFRQTGTAGQRDLIGDKTDYNQIHKITAIGNRGVSYVAAGSLVTNDLVQVNDYDFFVYGASYLRVIQGITFEGNLHLAQYDGSATYGSATARFETIAATGASATVRKTLVKGDFRTNTKGKNTTGANRVHGVYLAGTAAPHNLEVWGNLYFDTDTPFFVPRSARFIIGEGSTASEKAAISAPHAVYIQRVTVNRVAGAEIAEGVMYMNDLFLQRGVFTTHGNLAMADLQSSSVALDGPDASYNADLASQNYSIVTRDRQDSEKGGELSRGSSASGAYFVNNGTPFNPYTVQYTGTRGMDTADEIPYLSLIDTSTLNRLALNRLVINMTEGASLPEVELSKDLEILTRIETLSGNFDLGVSDLTIKADVQWVHGHATVTKSEGVLNYPSGTGRYDLMYVPQRNHATGYEFAANKVRNLTINTDKADVVVTLSQNHAISGDFRHIFGKVDLNGTTLSVALNHIHNSTNLIGTNYPAGPNSDYNGRVAQFFPAGTEFPVFYSFSNGSKEKGNDGNADLSNGTIRYTGAGYTLGFVQETKKEITFPHVVFEPTSAAAKRYFDLSQAFRVTTDVDVLPNAWNLQSYTQKNGETIIRSYESLAAASGAETSAATTGAEELADHNPHVENWNVLENMTVEAGKFRAYNGNITVFGNYTQGVKATGNAAVFYAGEVNPVRRMQFVVKGNFTVGEDAAADVQLAPEAGNRFFLNDANLFVGGDYAFFGHADVTDHIDHTQRGFRGTITFNGERTADDLQWVRHVQSPRAYFDHLVIEGRGVKLFEGDVNTATGNDNIVVNRYGHVSFKLGNVVTGDNELVIFNTSIDDLWSNEIASGAISYTGSNSFVEGNLRRYMSQGGTNGGMVTDGYVFPLGATYNAAGEQAFSGSDAVARYYRPLTLQFPANMGQTISAVVNSTVVAEGADLGIRPAIETMASAGTWNNPGTPYSIKLTERAALDWNITFDELPALEANVRIGVQGLITNAKANINEMRIVTPVSGTEYRIAGVYDLSVDGPDNTFNPNDYPDGIPTFIQEGVDFAAQQYNTNKTITLTIGTDGLKNPFASRGPVAYVQLINNVAGSNVDVEINGSMTAEGLSYQTATGFVMVPASGFDLKVYAAGTSQVVFEETTSTSLVADQYYVFVANGGANGKAIEAAGYQARTAANNASATELVFVHGVTNGGAFTVQRVSNDAHRSHEQTLAVNTTFGKQTTYQSVVNPTWTTVQIRTNNEVAGQYLFDLSGYQGETFTLIATGEVGSTANPLMLYGYDVNGNRIEPQVTTSENEDVVDVPVEFTLYSNYPNPFNPTTNIRFDLPEQANVRIDVVDATGRQVMTVAPQTMTSGANKVVTLDASRLASGVYFYRVIAEGASKTHILGSKFTLVK